MSYYSNVNPDLFSVLNKGALTVLEIGGGDGAMARTYKDVCPDARYFGIEIVPDVAKVGAPDFEKLVVGNVEDEAVLQQMDEACAGVPFDMLVVGDVLEHLQDPWATMTQLRKRMHTDGTAHVCIPNVGHWSLILKQMAGDWRYADQGLLDRTHLRFFTLDTATEMFQAAGWTVTAAKPRVFKRDAGEAVVKNLSALAKASDISMDVVRRNLLPLQWVFSLKVAG